MLGPLQKSDTSPSPAAAASFWAAWALAVAVAAAHGHPRPAGADAALAPPPAAEGVVIERLRLRAQPGLEGRIVRSLAAGTVVTLHGRRGQWLQASSPATTAWVHRDYLLHEGSATRTRERLNLREGPGTERAWIGALAAGAEIEPIEVRGEWVRIAVGAADGWLHTDYVRLAADESELSAQAPPALPGQAPPGEEVHADREQPRRAGDDTAARVPAAGGKRLAPPATESSNDATPAIMAVYLNRRPISPGVMLWRSDGAIFLPSRLLAEQRLPGGRFPHHREFEGRDHVGLHEVGGLAVLVDEERQELWLEAEPGLFEITRLGLGRSRYQPPERPSLGGFTHYDVTATNLSDRQMLDGDFELGVFGRLGTASTRVLTRSGSAGTELVRFASTWTIDLPARRQSVSIGDSRSRGGSWWNSIQLAGVSWASDFTTQPGFIPYALPTVTGEAAMASELELYLGEVLRARRQLPVGPFEVHELPVVSGDGTFRVVLRDQLGRETVMTRQFYVSPSLLRSGLREFHYGLGAIRESLGVMDHGEYGGPALVATERYGLTNRLTIEGHAELSEDHRLLGIGTTTALGRLGVGHLTVASSSSRSDGGALLWQYGLDRQGKSFAFGVQVQEASPSFRLLGFGGTRLAPERSVRARSSFSLGRIGSLALAYAERRLHDGPDFASFSASVNTRLGRKMFLSFSALATREPRRSESLSFTLTRLLGPARAAGVRVSASGTAGNRVGLRYQKARGRGEGIGYQLYAEGGDSSRVHAAVEVAGSAGALVFEGVGGQGTSGLRATLRGSLVSVDGQLHASRLTPRGFGLVSTGGMAGIRVYHENHLIGETNRKGYLVVPGLLPYQANRIRITEEDLPFGARVESLESTVSPYARSGLLIEFPIETSRSALLVLRQPDGAPVPAGARVLCLRTGEEFPVAFDGQVYVTGLGEREEFEVVWSEESCRFEFAWPPGVELEARPDPIVCRRP